LQENKIKLYPNPFNSKINISGATGSENSTLTNMFGQIIWTGNDIKQQDFSNLTSGIYFLTITKDNDRQTFKLIKE
jgi:glycine betaine/choline ABC-type transport system substrate-binding protein